MHKKVSTLWILTEIGALFLGILLLYASLTLIGRIDYALGKGTQSVSLRLLASSKVAIPFLPVAVIYGFRSLVRRKHPELDQRGYVSLLLHFLVLAFSVIAVFRFPYAGPNMFFSGFTDSVKEKLTPADFYKWTPEVRKEFGKQDEAVLLPTQEMPDFLKGFWSSRTPHILISPLHDSNVLVDIYYGGGFGHWGVKVGATNMNLTSGRRLRCTQVAPGIYTYYGP